MFYAIQNCTLYDEDKGQNLRHAHHTRVEVETHFWILYTEHRLLHEVALGRGVLLRRRLEARVVCRRLLRPRRRRHGGGRREPASPVESLELGKAGDVRRRGETAESEGGGGEQ